MANSDQKRADAVLAAFRRSEHFDSSLERAESFVAELRRAADDSVGGERVRFDIPRRTLLAYLREYHRKERRPFVYHTLTKIAKRRTRQQVYRKLLTFIKEECDDQPDDQMEERFFRFTQNNLTDPAIQTATMQFSTMHAFISCLPADQLEKWNSMCARNEDLSPLCIDVRPLAEHKQ